MLCYGGHRRGGDVGVGDGGCWGPNTTSNCRLGVLEACKGRKCQWSARIVFYAEVKGMRKIRCVRSGVCGYREFVG